MRVFIESLKRLYEKQEVSEEKLSELASKGIIDEKEKDYILGKEENRCTPY